MGSRRGEQGAGERGMKSRLFVERGGQSIDLVDLDLSFAFLPTAAKTLTRLLPTLFRFSKLFPTVTIRST
jgi:hypothetical protein